MPMHDWPIVHPCIFHAFHHGWLTTIGRYLNAALPTSHYAMPEQLGASSDAAVWRTAENDSEYYRRKKNSIVVRHISDDRMVAVIDIVSPGNKSTRDNFRAFVNKACELLEHRVHLLLIDPFPPTKRDPKGIHAAIWGVVSDEEFALPADKRLTVVAYEAGMTTRAYIEPIASGDMLPEMPLFLEPDFHVPTPLEQSYSDAFAVMPLRWRRVLESPSP